MNNLSAAAANNVGKLVKLSTIAGLLVTTAGLSGCASFAAVSSPESAGGTTNAYDRPAESYYVGRRETASPEEIVLDDESTIEDYFRIALQNNPSLQAAEQRWRASAEHPRQARSLPDPRLSLQADTSFQSREYSLSQTFPWFGKRALRGRAEEASVRIEAALYQARKLEIREDLRNAYGEYYYLSRAIDTTRTNLELLEYFLEIAKRRFEAGEVSRADVIRVEVETEKLRDRLAELTDQRRPRVAALNRVLGRPRSASLPWPVDLPEEHPIPLPESALMEQAIQNNPRLQALRAEVDRREEQKALAEMEYWPDITVGIMRMEEGMGGMSDDINAAMISINLPLWRNKYDAGVKEAGAGLEAGRYALSDRHYEIEANLENALFSFRDAERRTALYQDHLLPRAEESLRVSENAYRAADIDIIELLDAQRELLNFELAMERSKTDRFQAIGEIEKLVGRFFQ